MADIAAVKYRAFLSYSHRDESWAKWLHAALEGYRIDKDLVGRETRVGRVPETLRPIFRDRDDFSAGHSLTAQTLAALEASQFLIVVCSPNAAGSPYVNEEIRRFKMLGRAERIIPVIVDGEPGDGERECFPEALRFKLGPDGTLTGEREEPVAADARALSDGKELAKQKLLAGLLGLGLDEIVRRGERARRRRNRFWAALAGVFLMLAVAASGSAVYAWQQLKTNEAFLNATLKRATEIIDEAVAQAEKYNVPRAATLALLARAEGLFDDMAQYGRTTPELRYRKAWMLIQFARNYAILGDTTKQLARASQAQTLLAGLAAENPDDSTYQRDLATALVEVGDVLRNRGKLNEALESYRASLAIAERLAAADSNNAGRQVDISRARDRIGDVLLDQGQFNEALASYRASLAIHERLAAADPGNAGWQRNLSVSHTKVGDVLVYQAKLDEALVSYRAGLAILERLAAADPSDAGRQRDLSVSHSRIGDVLLDQGEHSEALASYQASLAIQERLAAADPSNTVWQRGLSFAHGKIGDVLRAQGKHEEALARYRTSLGISERMATADPGNARRQRDVSVLHGKIGDALRAQGRFDEALASYRASLAIAERLAVADPSNAGWQHDLATSHGRVALTCRSLGELAEALAEFRKGRQIMAALVERAPAFAQWKSDLAWFDGQIAALERQMQAAQK
jgi:tetratricopeptide (TPR) repeat protein